MDGFTEKKWFVYLGDHHEGPFSLSEIQAKMNFGQLSATNYVWSDGMSDWELMSQVRAFESVLTSANGARNTPVAELEAAAIQSLGPLMLERPEHAVASGPSLSSGPILSAMRPSYDRGGDHGDSHEPGAHRRAQKKSSVGSFFKTSFILMILAASAYGYTAGYFGPLLKSQTAQSMIEAAEPILAKLGISPIPQLDDVAPDEYAQLKSAAETALSQEPKIAIALSKGSLLSPTFYVASNLPDGTILDIYLEGISDTLLDQMSFSAKTEVVITKRIGKTNPLQFSQGSALARGQYNLFIVDPGTQPQSVTPLIGQMSQIPATTPGMESLPKGLRVIGTQQYFLGGQRDATYAARLKDFHDKIMAKAQQELMELKQVAMTLDSQFSDTNKNFSQLRRGRRLMPSQKRAWRQFDRSWTQLSQQLGQLFSKLTPESAQTDYFYGALYLQSKQASDAINQLHSIQSTYFTGGAGRDWDPKAFSIQLGETEASAKAAEDLLKANIDQVSKLPPSASGLPQKFGDHHAAE